MKVFCCCFAVVGSILLFCASGASASPVTYSTEGSFNGNPFATNNSLTLGGITLSYTGTAATVNANPTTFANVGAFSASGEGTGDFTGQDFDLRITQTVPGGGSGTVDADLSGVISSGPPGSSTLIVTFNSPIFSIGEVQYSVQPTVLVPIPGQNATITAQITIPEPASITMLTSVGALLAARRRRR